MSEKLSDYVTTLKPEDIGPQFRAYSSTFLEIMRYESSLPAWKRWVRAFCRLFGVQVFRFGKGVSR